MKTIILGRGYSCLNSTKEFVDSHDLIAVTNKFIFKGYEKYVSNRADIQFRNGTAENFSEDEFNRLKLKKIIYTHNSNKFPSYPKYYKNIEIITPQPRIKILFKKEFGFDEPSSGIIATYYMLKNYDIREMSLVGFDFYSLNTPPYYFKPEDADSNLKYLWKNKYKNNVINSVSGHNEEKSIEVLMKLIKENKNTKFNMITNSIKVKNHKYNNLNFI